MTKEEQELAEGFYTILRLDGYSVEVEGPNDISTIQYTALNSNRVSFILAKFEDDFAEVLECKFIGRVTTQNRDETITSNNLQDVLKFLSELIEKV